MVLRDKMGMPDMSKESLKLAYDVTRWFGAIGFAGAKKAGAAVLSTGPFNSQSLAIDLQSSWRDEELKGVRHNLLHASDVPEVTFGSAQRIVQIEALEERFRRARRTVQPPEEVPTSDPVERTIVTMQRVGIPDFVVSRARQELNGEAASLLAAGEAPPIFTNDQL